MGSISSMFLRAAGDVVIAGTRYFPTDHLLSARRIEGAAMRCAYVALCYAALAPLVWDTRAERVRLSGSPEAHERMDEVELKRLAKIVCHERLSHEDLWNVRVFVGEKLMRVHADCVNSERRIRRVRRDLSDDDEPGVHDGHLVALEGETPNTRWHDVVVAVKNWIPVQTHETLVRVVEGAARLCIEEVLLRHAEIFDTTSGVTSKFPNEQHAHDARIAMLTRLLPHLADTVRRHGCVTAADRVMREFETLVARVRRMEDRRIKEADKHRRFGSTAPSEHIYMMSVVSARIDAQAKFSEEEEEPQPMAAFTVAPFGGSLEPDPEVARAHLGKLLETAFAASYSARSDAYMLGRPAARRIAEAAVSACYALYTEPADR